MAGQAAAQFHRGLADAAPLAEVCEFLLGASGPLAEVYPHWRESAVQIAYARAVADTLEAGAAPGRMETAVSGLSADTGVGKTWGYLVALIAHHARTGHRVGVATYSHALIRQILAELTVNGKAPSRALKAVWKALGQDPDKAPLVALRAGRQEFVSPARVDLLIHRGQFQEAERKALVALRAWARRSLSANGPSGLIRDYVQTHGELPASISPDDICLLTQSNDADAAAYTHQCARAEGASLLLCTHHALLYQSRRGYGLWSESGDDLRIRAVVVDEADHLPKVAASILSTYMPLYLARGRVRELAAAKTSSRSYKAHVAELESALGELEHKTAPLLPRENRPQAMLKSGAQAAKSLIPLLENVQEALKGISTNTKRWNHLLGGPGTSFIAELSANVREILNSLKGENSWRVPFLRITPIREWVGIGVQPRGPGHILGGLWTGNHQAKLDSMVLTSATLTAPGADGMRSFLASVGLKLDSPRFLFGESFEPAHHGELQFNLTDPRVPKPVQGYDEDLGRAVLDTEWLEYAGAMIKKAASTRKRVLVLCSSYQDVATIEPYLSGVKNLLLHRSSDDRGTLLERFRAIEGSVYVTPTGWEGLDLPNLISHLVILRLPFPPPNSTEFIATTSWAGMDPSEQMILRAQSAFVIRRVRQAIGRVLRQPDAKASVWIADVRFPLPGALLERLLMQGEIPIKHRGAGMLRAAIPRRFVEGKASAFNQARILTLDGNLEGF